MSLTGTNGDCLNVSTDGTGDALVAHTSGAAATLCARSRPGSGISRAGASPRTAACITRVRARFDTQTT